MAESKSEKPEYVGVFVADQEYPVATFSDADEAQRYRKQRYGDRGLVAPVTGHSKAPADVRDTVADIDRNAPRPAAPADIDVDALDKGIIRTRLETEERQKRLEEDARREMEQDNRVEAKG